jgi:hypothetical protein
MRTGGRSAGGGCSWEAGGGRGRGRGRGICLFIADGVNEEEEEWACSLLGHSAWLQENSSGASSSKKVTQKRCRHHPSSFALLNERMRHHERARDNGQCWAIRRLREVSVTVAQEKWGRGGGWDLKGSRLHPPDVRSSRTRRHW